MSKHKRVNGQIRAERVHLILADGKSQGEVSLRKALDLARAQGMDLVEVSPSSNPPIVKVANWGKIKYQEKKRRAKVKSRDTKEIRLRLNTGEHDKENKRKLARKFLGQGHKVRVSMILRGREKQFKEDAIAKVKEFVDFKGAKTEITPRYAFGKVTSIIMGTNNASKK